MAARDFGENGIGDGGGIGATGCEIGERTGTNGTMDAERETKVKTRK